MEPVTGEGPAMHFSTFDLDRGRLLEALPLVRMALPGIGRERWIACGEALAESGGGVLGTAAADGAVHGLAAYRCDEDPGRGKVIRVGLMLAFEFSPAAPVRRSLLAALDGVRQRHEALDIILPTPSDKARSLAGAGFEEEAFPCWKPSAQARDTPAVERRGHG